MYGCENYEYDFVMRTLLTQFLSTNISNCENNNKNRNKHNKY